MGHGIRLMMDNWAMEMPRFNGVIEMDEKCFGGRTLFVSPSLQPEAISRAFSTNFV